ncbi:MAG: respiratory nitrate reductase subunit gamma [Actinomyces sp.]|nr:respiratory nitrate reductase subunit gamma [Actinomyces sp.]MDN6793848.1 respiratory nitrate reductase subunit gamma [Propionibacterium sp.]
MSTLLWVVLPYVSLTLLVVGMVWRWRSDRFGWTSRSSELYESKMLRISSPLFHYGILLVALGHFMGLLVPKSWTTAWGVHEHTYHLIATIPGAIAAVMTIVGLVGLLYRRFVIRSVRLATSRSDLVMYAFLTLAILLGGFATLTQQILGTGGEGYDYRETISPWLRSILSFQPRPELMADVPLAFKLHVVAGFLLFAVWPFTRLVHAVSAPLGYVSRPYVVYRSASPSVGTSPSARGWSPVGSSRRRRRRRARSSLDIDEVGPSGA